MFFWPPPTATRSRPKTKGPGARDGERSFGRHPRRPVPAPGPKRTRGQGPGRRARISPSLPQKSTNMGDFEAAPPADEASIKGQEPGLVNVLLAATHSNSFTTSALRCERVCSVGCKRTSTSPGSWPLIARGRERVAGLAAKERAPSLPPGPFVRRSRTSGCGWRPKDRSPALAPGP